MKLIELIGFTDRTSYPFDDLDLFNFEMRTLFKLSVNYLRRPAGTESSDEAKILRKRPLTCSGSNLKSVRRHKVRKLAAQQRHRIGLDTCATITKACAIAGWDRHRICLSIAILTTESPISAGVYACFDKKFLLKSKRDGIYLNLDFHLIAIKLPTPIQTRR
jgi:hypothetical protein